MTDLLKAAYKAADKDTPEIEVSKQLILDWMDDKIAGHEKMCKAAKSYVRDLNMGKLNALGRYTDCIRMTSSVWSDRKEIHVFCGVRKLADACGEPVSERTISYRDGSDRIELSFVYKGYTFFQLEEDKEK